MPVEHYKRREQQLQASVFNQTVDIPTRISSIALVHVLIFMRLCPWFPPRQKSRAFKTVGYGEDMGFISGIPKATTFRDILRCH
jgi:hypothetical protein